MAGSFLSSSYSLQSSTSASGTSIGSSLGSSSVSRSSSSGSSGYMKSGKPFKMMVEDIMEFKQFIKVETKFIISLSRCHYHWFLLVKMKDSEFPYLTIEITTSNMSDLVPAVRLYEHNTDWKAFGLSQPPEKVDVYHGTLLSLCEKADRVVRDMNFYSLFSNNCQHFCNNLLARIGLNTFPPTIGSETTISKKEKEEEMKFDLLEQVESKYFDFVKKVAAKALNKVVGAP